MLRTWLRLSIGGVMIAVVGVALIVDHFRPPTRSESIALAAETILRDYPDAEFDSSPAEYRGPDGVFRYTYIIFHDARRPVQYTAVVDGTGPSEVRTYRDHRGPFRVTPPSAGRQQFRFRTHQVPTSSQSQTSTTTDDDGDS